MPNRKRQRRITRPPVVEGFKPFGIPRRELDSITLLFEEYEAIRLADYEKLTQEEAAQKMGVSRPTFTRIYDKARKSVAAAFVESKVILFEGGSYVTDEEWYRCRDCHSTLIKQKRRRENMQKSENCGNCDSDNIQQL